MAQHARILLVDDEAAVTKVIGERLRTKGYNVTTAADGEEAMRKAADEQPHLIILDVMLPGLNGYEVCARLKRDEALKHIPVIMFTAKGQTQEHVVGLMCGADVYVNKTCDFNTLLEQIQSLLAS